jgi:hypothetical protein
MLSSSGAAIAKVMQENPCELGSPEYETWQAALMVAILYGNVPPTENDIPAYWEGYERGVQFNEEWE